VEKDAELLIQDGKVSDPGMNWRRSRRNSVSVKLHPVYGDELKKAA